MKSNIIAAAILALGLVAAGFMIGGRYYFMRLDTEFVARGDRWTGSVEVVCVGEDAWAHMERCFNKTK